MTDKYVALFRELDSRFKARGWDLDEQRHRSLVYEIALQTYKAVTGDNEMASPDAEDFATAGTDYVTSLCE